MLSGIQDVVNHEIAGLCLGEGLLKVFLRWLVIWGLVVCATLLVSMLRDLGFPCSGFGASPCIVSGLLALPLCGAALTFFAAA
ncbi:hypothetical protein PQQ75_33055, partial [Paraburkholderia aspalathi]|uniref:hypothetical protein n=1 Tax=Paraburkholderia aspalathi TaxID=1324617 RepID=UPI0038BB8F2F